MAATPSIKVLKTGPWHGGTRVWSNRYHFNGGTPADGAHWKTFMDLVAADEAAALDNNQTITEIIGYAAGSDLPVHSESYSTVGTYSPAGGARAPLEVAGLIRYSTTARSSKNHPIYLFNYMHGANVSAGGSGALSADYLAALQEYATDWIAGYSDGTNTYVRAGPNGATATGFLVATYATHRDFPK